jgi:hypothetical protein
MKTLIQALRHFKKALTRLPAWSVLCDISAAIIDVGIILALGWMAILATSLFVGALANSEGIYAKRIHAELSLFYGYIDTLP